MPRILASATTGRVWLVDSQCLSITFHHLLGVRFMFLNRSVVQCAVISGIVLGSAWLSFAQSGAPVQEQPREVGPRTLEGDRAIQERERAERHRVLARDRAGDRTVVQERVVERRREGEVYVSGFGGFTWGHDLSDVEGRGTLGGQQFGGRDLKNLKQGAAAAGGQYVSALASLYGISADKQAEFGLVLQRKHADLFTAGIEEDRTRPLKLVSALNRELATASLLP